MEKAPAATDDLSFAFIRDEAADEDFFGSHNRVATAIVTVIKANADLKVIGLLGPWGSGKSTIIKLVQSELKRDGKTTTYCFSYNAWLHQNDPPRRSFLETLLHYLVGEKLTNAEKWQNRIEQLNRQVEDSETTSTPTLTTLGRLIVFSLFLLPLGMQFVSHDWYHAATDTNPSGIALWGFPFGIICLLLPALLAAYVYWSWRPVVSPGKSEFWRRTNWTEHKHPHEHDSIISLFMNKEVQKIRNRVTRAPDPTTIEFQDIFREIMDAVNAPNRRFLFVIDNLDRLAETEAVRMWSTIRSFFLGARETKHVRKITSLPTVILPIDEDAIRRMYTASHGSDAEGLAKSFMDKTFDLSFRVTRPVLTDWTKYLERQMRAVFGPNMPVEWPHITGRLYEKFLTAQSKPNVTPRTINTLINSIAVLWLQWQDSNISFGSVVYYSIFREMIDNNILAAVATPAAGISELDPEWQRAIAAIHYGVKPFDAVQILIEQPLRKAIAEKDLGSFKELSGMPSFDRVLLRIFDQFGATLGVEPQPVFHAALLLASLPDQTSVSMSDAWRVLRSAFRQTAIWTTFGEEEVGAIQALLASCNSYELPQFTRVLDVKLRGRNEGVFNSPNFPSFFAATWKAAFEVAQAKSTELQRILVPGPASIFLSVITACHENNQLLKLLDTALPEVDLVQELAGDLLDQVRAVKAEARLNALIALGRTMPWDALVNASVPIIRDQNANHPAIAAALLGLGHLRNSEEIAKTQIKILVASGQLVNRLNEAYAAKNDIVVARSVALLMLTNPNFPIPEGGNWEKTFAERADLVQLINDALVEFDSIDNLQALIEATATNANLQSIVRAVVSLRVRSKQLGKLQLEQIITNLALYLSCISPDLHESFLKQLSDYETFWDELEKQPFEGNVTTILHTLIKREGEAGAVAQEFLRVCLDHVASAVWEAAIRDGLEPLIIASALAAHAKIPVQIGSQLFDALQTIIPGVLSNAELTFRARWFEAETLLGPNGRHTLLRNLRDQINSGVQISELAALLAAGGADFVKASGFSDEPDDSVRHVILPLLSSPHGIDWLVKEAIQMKSWVDASIAPTKSFLTERLLQFWQTGDAEVKEKLKSLQFAWALPDLSAMVKSSKDGGGLAPEEPESNDT